MLAQQKALLQQRHQQMLQLEQHSPESKHFRVNQSLAAQPAGNFDGSYDAGEAKQFSLPNPSAHYTQAQSQSLSIKQIRSKSHVRPEAHETAIAHLKHHGQN